MKLEYSKIFFIICFLAVLYLFFKIFQPFLAPIMWAVLLTTVFYPFNMRMKTWLGGRESLGSFLSCILIALIIVLPVIFSTILLAKQSLDAYDYVDTLLNSDKLVDFAKWEKSARVSKFLLKFGKSFGLESLDLKAHIITLFEKASSFLASYSSQIIYGFADFLLGFFIMLITMFFLFRDGSKLIEQVKQLNPLPVHYELLVINQFKEVSSATLYGGVLTCLAHGFFAGLIFLALRIPSALLLGAVTAFLSFVPFLGAFLVWIPVAIYLFLTGSAVKGIVLIISGAIVVSAIDNVLKPFLIKGRTKTHTFLVFLSVLGGLKVFGLLGLFLGPLIVAILLTFLYIYKVEFRDELAKELITQLDPEARKEG